MDRVGVRFRRPAPGAGRGEHSGRFYRSAGAVSGRPRVVVHQGDRTLVRVGRAAEFGRDVEILIGGNHRIDWVAVFAIREQYRLPGAYRHGNPWSRGDVLIGEGARIGPGARVLSGVRIGRRAVIGPYAVVTRDVPDGSYAAGHPAETIGAAPLPRVPDPANQPAIDRSEVSLRQRIVRWPAAVRRRVAAGLRTVADHVDGALAEYPFEHLPAQGDPPPEVVMGRASYFEPTVIRPPGRLVRVTVGNYASVAANCECVFDVPALHPDPAAVSSQSGSDPTDLPTEVVIGSDTWVTRGTKLMAGVTVGDGAVVGAYSVVYDDVRPYAIVAGNPAKEVGRRFDDETVAALLRIRWWDWSDEEVRARADDLCSRHVDAFVRRFDPGQPAGS